MIGWNIKKSQELYNIAAWSNGYFNINPQGNVVVTPKGDGGPSVDLKELVKDLQSRGLRTPILLRFPDIVESRVKHISQAFQSAFQMYGYKGRYQGVYPIKVNQQRHLVEEIVNFGAESNLGLEAGSKPELLIALAVMDNPNAVLICNGFKDTEYIDTALLAQKLGRKTIIVVDRLSELSVILQSARKLNMRPNIGFRAKLEAKGAGKWVESSGARSKFGLTSVEMVKGLEELRAADMLDSLKLLHFHIGSQITAIRAIKNSLVEACRVYTELCALGAKLEYMDVGGGLAVDYDGSHTNWESSKNYSVQEYANDVVSAIQNACDEKGLAHPHIVTESGRAMVAYHSVLVFDVVGSNELILDTVPAQLQSNNKVIKEMSEIYGFLNTKNLTEFLHDAVQLKDEAQNMFNVGILSLKERAEIENMFWAICSKVQKVAKEHGIVSEELETLERNLSDTYYCNFSVFQSAPDTWAVDQVFPIMPIHRLNEEPSRKAILVDLTCDSDGKVDRFIDIKDVKHSLEVHPIKPNEPYMLGIFLVGAYQEILGDFHNLFGDTDAVHICIDEMGYTIQNIVEGDTVNEVLSYVQYDKASLMNKIRTAVENGIRNKTISMEEVKLLLRYYEDGLSGYTYLEEADLNSALQPSLQPPGNGQTVTQPVAEAAVELAARSLTGQVAASSLV